MTVGGVGMTVGELGVAVGEFWALLASISVG